jgi:hypothetical protein
MLLRVHKLISEIDDSIERKKKWECQILMLRLWREAYHDKKLQKEKSVRIAIQKANRFLKSYLANSPNGSDHH